MKKLIVIFFILTIILSVNAESRDTIAVLDFDARNVTKDSAAVITDLIRSELNKKGSFKILERSNMDKILSEHELQSTGITDTDNAVKAGKILNVEFLLYGSFSKLGNAYIISATVVDVESAAIVFSDSEKFYRIEESDIAVRNIVSKISGQKENKKEEQYSVPITGKKDLDIILNSLRKKYLIVNSKRYKHELIDYLYAYDDIIEDYYAFVLYKVIDIPTKKVKIKAASNYLPGITFSPPYTTKAAQKAFKAGKPFALQAKVFTAPEGDPRRMEYRVYQKNGKPVAIEIFVVTRNSDWTPKKAKSLKYDL